MIRNRDAIILSYTKLRTRIIRLFITIFISSLLFSILAGMAFVTSGAFHSFNNFSKEGLGGRYIISGVFFSNGGNILSDKELISRVQQLYDQDIVAKKKAAKSLGIEYDAKSERLPIVEYDSPNGKERNLDPVHRLTKLALAEYSKQHPQPSLNDFKNQAGPYKPSHYYQSRGLGYGGTDAGVVKVLKDGREEIEASSAQRNGPPTGLDGFSQSWSLMSEELLKPFTLDGNVHSDDPSLIPVVAPYTAVEQLLDLKALPASATGKQKLERLKEVRSKAAGIRFDVCYRNSTSLQQLDQAVQDQQQVLQNKGNKDYQKPDVIKDIPADACGAPRVTRDVRTTSQKNIDAKQEQFRQMFGEKPAMAKILHFRVVGLAPDPPLYNASGVSQIFRSLLGSTIGPTWFSPLQVATSEPEIDELFSSTNQFFGGFGTSYYAEFTTAKSAQDFLNKGNCQAEGPTINEGGPTPDDQATDCVAKKQPFTLIPFGSSSLAIDSFKKYFSKFFRIATLIAATVASIIMMGSLGRVIADSRRETAVFRAIGAKRLDIAQIYLTYIVYVALLIAACAALLGFIFARFIEARFGQQFTIEALLAYNASDLSRQFHLFGWAGKEILYLVLCILLAGLVSSVFPLLRNLRRNPIKDMRDEN
jgi:hypothetical protein